MDVKFWLENWKQNKIGFHQTQPNNHLVSYWQHLHLEPNSRVFIPLSGKSLDLIWLSEQGHSVLGVEISELAVGQFFSENGLNSGNTKLDNFQQWQAEKLIILQGNFFNLNSNHVKDITGVFDRASLIALPPELRKKYAQHLKTILPKAAKILLIALEYDQAIMDGPPFCVDEHEVQSLFSDHYDIELLLIHNTLSEFPQFQEIGLSSLHEKIYLLRPNNLADR